MHATSSRSSTSCARWPRSKATCRAPRKCSAWSAATCTGRCARLASCRHAEVRMRSLSEIPTPALIVDVGALDRNIARMAAFFASGRCRLRPHFKAHKTPEIARRQLAAGSCVGITCATVAEAEVAADLCDDLLIANEVVSADKCVRVAALARQIAVTVAVDSTVGIEALASAARAAGVTIGVLVDVNVGQGRCGVEPGDAALALARQAASVAGLTLRGVMGYEGHLQPLRDRGERESRAREAMHELAGTARRIREAG